MTTPPPIERLTQAIHDGQAHMQPRWRYALRAGLILFGGILLAGGVIYVISLLLFARRAGGTGILPHFGLLGWQLTLQAIPWWLVLVATIGTFGVFWLLEKTTASYRRPMAVV